MRCNSWQAERRSGAIPYTKGRRRGRRSAIGLAAVVVPIIILLAMQCCVGAREICPFDLCSVPRYLGRVEMGLWGSAWHRGGLVSGLWPTFFRQSIGPDWGFYQSSKHRP